MSFFRLRKHRTTSPEMIRRKLVLVGDGYCGKTSLQVAFRKDEFDCIDLSCYRPTIFETYATEIQIEDDFVMELTIWDTAGQEDYERLRPLSYPHADVIVLCFAIDSPDSLENIEDKWARELDYFCPGVPVILVGK